MWYACHKQNQRILFSQILKAKLRSSNRWFNNFEMWNSELAEQFDWSIWSDWSFLNPVKDRNQSSTGNHHMSSGLKNQTKKQFRQHTNCTENWRLKMHSKKRSLFWRKRSNRKNKMILKKNSHPENRNSHFWFFDEIFVYKYLINCN